MSEANAIGTLSEYVELATSLKILSADIVENAGSGHLGMPLGMADAFTVLFRDFFYHDPADHLWADRDRLVLSVGHGSPLLYGLLHLTGYQIGIDDLKSFRKLNSSTPGHPEVCLTPGIEATTGLLGQGIGVAAGMALAERFLNARFSDEIVNHTTYCVVGDGCMMEGISHEAASLMGHLGVGNLIMLFDDNHATIDGDTALTVSDDVLSRFRAYGWHAVSCDGHDYFAIHQALAEANAEKHRPSLISLRTVIGKGSPSREGTSAAHGGPLGAAELKLLRQSLGWFHGPFVIPDQLRKVWQSTGARGQAKRRAWHRRLARDAEQKTRFEAQFDQAVNAETRSALQSLKRQQIDEKPECATRFASLKVLEQIRHLIPGFLGGAADVTISTFTKPDGVESIRPSHFDGSHVHYGVREHLMSAMMNGMALHGGVRPYGGTYLCFLDYARPAVRMSAMMKLGVIYICTHDSIGAGDDGPTHQAIEQISSWRGMPNILIMRPSDAVEVGECWQVALEQSTRPTLLLLSAQGWPITPTGLPVNRSEFTEDNLCARGAYVVSEAQAERDLTILATGSEVTLAIEAQKRLALENISACVVSMPCWELFEEQNATYREHILGKAPRIAVEAATPFGWARYVAAEEDVVCVRSFGASAKVEDLYSHFSINSSAIVEKAKLFLAKGRTK